MKKSFNDNKREQSGTMKTLNVIFTVLLLVCGLYANAQTAHYTYIGGSVQYSVVKQDSLYYIIVAVRSEKLCFMKDPVMLLKTFDGEVLTLHGSHLGEGTESLGMVLGNMVLPLTEITSTAQFDVTPEQLEKLGKGVSKVRLSTVPKKHEKTFRKDKIGKKLYLSFMQQKNKVDDF